LGYQGGISGIKRKMGLNGRGTSIYIGTDPMGKRLFYNTTKGGTAMGTQPLVSWRRQERRPDGGATKEKS